MTPFTEFTDAQWAAIQASRGDWLPGIDWASAARCELEQAGRGFWMMRANRLRRRPRAQLEHLLEQARDLNLGPFAERALENRLIVDEVWNSQHFRRRADAHRELLYWHVLTVWTNLFGGKLEISRVGPLRRYLTTVLTPILGGEAPTGGGLTDIVSKERRRRRGHVLDTKKRLQNMI